MSEETFTDFEPLLTKEEVCQILGVKESWLNTEIQAGRIPHLRLGKKKFVRFTRANVLEYLESRERPISEAPQ